MIVDPDPKCGACDPCRAGRPASCLNVVALGIFRDGGLAAHVLAPAGAVYPDRGGLRGGGRGARGATGVRRERHPQGAPRPGERR